MWKFSVGEWLKVRQLFDNVQTLFQQFLKEILEMKKILEQKYGRGNIKRHLKMFAALSSSVYWDSRTLLQDHRILQTGFCLVLLIPVGDSLLIFQPIILYWDLSSSKNEVAPLSIDEKSKSCEMKELFLFPAFWIESPFTNFQKKSGKKGTFYQIESLHRGNIKKKWGKKHQGLTMMNGRYRLLEIRLICT